MNVEVHQNWHDDCRSFGSNIHLSSQSRKISIGVTADSKANTRCGTIKGERATMPNTGRVISNVGNFIGENSKVEEVVASFNIKRIGRPEEVKYSRISKSFYQRTPTSETILQANQASCLLFSNAGGDKPDGEESVPAKNSVQLFSNQTSIFPSSNYNQKKFDGDTSERKGKKDGTTEMAEEFTFTTAQEFCESDKTKPEDKRNRTENRTENLRMKLWQILETTSYPKTQHSGSQTRDMDEGSLQLKQGLKQGDDNFVKTRQNSDTIETDSENADHTNKRPVTRPWIRKRASAKRQPAKGKSGLSSKDKENPREKNIFSFEEKWSGKRDAFLNDGSSVRLRKKSQRKNSRIRSRKICFPENDTADKLGPDTSETDIPQHDGATFSLGNKMGGFIDCLSDHQTKCPQTEKINQETYQSSTVNKIDQHGELEASRNGNKQEYRSNPVVLHVAKSQDIFQSPTFQFKTPLSSSLSLTPKTDQKANDVSSPASTERRFSLGNIPNLRTFQILEPDCDRPRALRQSTDMEELEDSIPRKTAFFVKENESQDGSSDSSSEERNFQRPQEGSRETHTAERKSFMLHPIKRLCRREGIKFNDSSPASLSSKGTGDSDWIHEASEQNQDGFVRAVERFALELGKLKSKLESVTSQKSSEILKSVAEEIHLQLQNVHSQIQTDIGELTSLSKSKRKRLETRFEDQQKQLRLISEKFKEEVNLHLQDCRSTVESLEADQIEIKGALEKQRAAHRKLLSQVEEAVEIQLNDAQRNITATREMARKKLLQLKHVIAMCLKEDVLN